MGCAAGRQSPPGGTAATAAAAHVPPVLASGPGAFFARASHPHWPGGLPRAGEGSSEPELAALTADSDAAIEAELERDLAGATAALVAADGGGAPRLPLSSRGQQQRQQQRATAALSTPRPDWDGTSFSGGASASPLEEPSALAGLEAHAPKVLSFYRRKCLELASQVHRRDTEVVQLRQALNEARAAKAAAAAAPDGNSAGTGELTAEPVNALLPLLVQLP